MSSEALKANVPANDALLAQQVRGAVEEREAVVREVPGVEDVVNRLRVT